jgi:hypothetical protein
MSWVASALLPFGVPSSEEYLLGVTRTTCASCVWEARSTSERRSPCVVGGRAGRTDFGERRRVKSTRSLWQFSRRRSGRWADGLGSGFKVSGCWWRMVSCLPWAVSVHVPAQAKCGVSKNSWTSAEQCFCRVKSTNINQGSVRYEIVAGSRDSCAWC